MSDLLNLPLENSYETTVAQTLAASASALTLYVKTSPVFTFPTSTKTRVIVSAGKDGYEEEMIVESYNSTTKALTVSSGGRAQSLYNGHSATPLAHPSGRKVIITDGYGFWNDIKTSIATKLDSDADDTVTANTTWSSTTKIGVKPNTLTTAQRDAIVVAGSDTGIIKNSTSGEYNVLQGAAWSALATGSTQPDGSTTVAGKFEEGTVAEQGTATATGGTGARLVVAVANLVKTSSGAGDENKIAILDSAGKFAEGFMTYDATEAEIDQVCDNVGATGTAANLTALTDKSSVLLHEHILNLTKYLGMAESGVAMPRTSATLTFLGASLADTANEEATTIGCFFRPTGYNITSVKMDLHCPLIESGNLYLEFRGSSFTPGSSAVVTTDTVAIAAVAVVVSGNDGIVTLTVPSTAYTSWTAGKRIAFTLRRDASNAADTIEQNIIVMGTEVVYALA
jgi:hypothetical protein